MALALLACGPVDSERSQPAPRAAALQGSQPALTTPTFGSRAWLELSARERARRIALQQENAGPAYAVRSDAGKLLAEHPSMAFRSRFQRGGVSLVLPRVASSVEGPLELAVARWGCQGAMARVPAVAPGLQGDRRNRVVYEHQGFNEWYVHGPLGLEQGFTVSKLPECARRGGKLRIELADSPGFRSEPKAGLGSVSLVSEGGRRVGYGEAFAVDARDSELPVRLAAVDRPGGVMLTLDVDVAGAELPLMIDPIAWEHQQRLARADAEANEYLAHTVDVDGDTAAFGVWADNDLGTNSGSAYVFTRSGRVWSQQQKILASDGVAGDAFGTSVALDGDTLVVGANADDSFMGTARVFVRSGNTWSLQQKLVASTPMAGDNLGISAAISGDTVVVGADGVNGGATYAGAAYVFVRSGSTWTEQQILTASDPGTSHFFGSAVAISGDTALIGAYGHNSAQGAAYVFVRNAGVWTEQDKLLASDGGDDYQFGTTVSVSGDTAIIGMYSGVAGAFGAAYVFQRTGSSWDEQQRLTPSDAIANHGFGRGVAVSGDLAVISASIDQDNGWASGAAYVFSRSGSTWSQQQKLKPADGKAYDELGVAVALSGTDTFAVAAPGHDGDASGAGTVYIFGHGPTNGSSCAAGADCVSGFCSEGVCCDEACTGACRSCLASRKGSGADGTCGNVSAGSDPRNSCSADAASTCDQTGECDGAGLCQLFAQGTECAASSCPSATSENPADSCDGSGACGVTATEACPTGYACVSGACRTDCTDSSHCDAANGFECIDGACKFPLGNPCDAPGDCATGHCVDGVCCESDCADTCMGCSTSLTNLANGLCRPIPADLDPQEECEQDDFYPSNCQEDGACDGEGACRAYAKNGTPCETTTCTAGSITGMVCNGAGMCNQATVPCEPYVCQGDICGTSCLSDDECNAVGGYCLPQQVCASRSPDGAECLEDRQCRSGFCVDGLCCDSACAGQCAFCAEPGREGECIAVPGAPRGERPACTAAGEVCGGECDGVETDVCHYPPTTTNCARSCNDGEALLSSCDGQGACVALEPNPCSPYVCGADACLTTCADEDAIVGDAACSTGFRCNGEECVPSSAQCSTDLSASLPAEGAAVPCAPFRCNPTSGECRDVCNSSTECASGFACDPADKSCKRSSSASEEGGCGCALPGSRRSGSSLLALVLGLGLILARRKARLPD